MSIPQVVPWLGSDEAEAVAAVIRDNWITEGPRCAEFSRRLNEMIGVPFGVFAPNGTLALALGMMAVGVKAGDEVLIPDVTFIGSATAVLMLGAKPVPVDVDPLTYQLDIAQAERLVGPQTRAIMPVHLYGMSCNMEAVTAFARFNGLHIIEDAAQGIGVYNMGSHVGSLSDVGCFSFFADKTLTTGEGGYVVTSDEEIYRKLRCLRNQGRDDRGTFIHPEIGFNFRITDLQAAIGLVQLDKLDEVIQRKRSLFDLYRRELSSVNHARILGEGIVESQVPFRCVLIAEQRTELEAYLKNKGIQTRGFFFPLHRQPCLVEWANQQPVTPSWIDSSYPNAEQGFESGLCLPIYPTLDEEQVLYICDNIKRFYQVA